MTPTLAMVVMRDAAIRAFKPEPFYSCLLYTSRHEADLAKMRSKKLKSEQEVKAKKNAAASGKKGGKPKKPTTSTERKTLTALSVRYSGFPGPMPTP